MLLTMDGKYRVEDHVAFHRFEQLIFQLLYCTNMCSQKHTTSVQQCVINNLIDICFNETYGFLATPTSKLAVTILPPFNFP